MDSQDRYNSVFATRLRELIESRHITITSLAEELGITRQAVSNYTYGGGQPTVDKLKKICDYFSVSADYLLGLDDYMYREHFVVTAQDMGLSEVAASFLEDEHYKNNSRISNVLNLMVESESFSTFAFAMENYLEGVELIKKQNTLGPDEVINLIDLPSDDDLQIRKFILNEVFNKMLDKIYTKYDLEWRKKNGKYKEKS